MGRIFSTVLGFFTGGGSPLLVIGVVVAIAAGGVGLYIKAIRAENESLTIQRDDATRAARHNAMVHELYKADIGKALSAERREEQRHQARAVKAETKLREVMNAPPEDDAPVAPVLRRALDGLRGSVPSAAGNPGGAPAGTGQHAGRPAQAAAAR